MDPLTPLLFGPDGQPVRIQQEDIFLMAIVWRGSNVIILSNKPNIQRLEFNDRRNVAEQFKKQFEADFGPNIYL